MSDDLKMVVDISADLSKLDSSLQRAEAKVAASGQKMQRAASFTPGVGVGSSMTSAGGGFLMAAPHPNNVSFSSLNAGGGGGFGSPGAFRIGAGNAGTSMGAFGLNRPPPNAVSFSSLNATAGGGFGGGGGGINWASIGSGGDGDGGAGGAAMAGMMSSTLGRAAGLAGMVYAAARTGTTLGASAGNYDRARGAFFNAGSGRNRAHFLAEMEQHPMPIFGGMMETYRQQGWGGPNQFGANINFTNTGAVQEDITSINRRNNLGMFGGGLAGKFRDLSVAKGLMHDEMERMHYNKVDPNTITNYWNSATADMRRQRDELGVDEQQRHLNLSSAAKQMNLRAMGMGKYAEIEAINRSFGDQLAHAVDDTPQHRQDLQRLQRTSVAAVMFGNRLPAQAVSMSGMGESFRAGSVRVGSMSGQDFPAIVEWLRKISDHTEDPPTPRVR